MADAVTKLAYEALQQGKSLVGVAHKEISTRLMERHCRGPVSP